MAGWICSRATSIAAVDRHRSREFVAFLRTLDEAYPEGVDVSADPGASASLILAIIDNASVFPILNCAHCVRGVEPHGCGGSRR